MIALKTVGTVAANVAIATATAFTGAILATVVMNRVKAPKAKAETKGKAKGKG